MAISSRFLDELKSRLSVSEVVSRRVRLQRKGREHSGLCPFHHEKTPSFTVNDDKGFYHCFGCGAHGSVIDFVMNTENLGFRETVERLASEAGLAMPEETADDRAREQTRRTLVEVMELAVRWYQRQLRMPEGAKALAYLRRRRLGEDIIERFRLGFSPDTRDGLHAYLTGEGVPESDMIAAGLRIVPQDPGRRPYDRFRGRVMFPICDRQGRPIAFGGRILDSGEPKYLNSPETELFHKGRTLYGLDLALPAARQRQQLLVVEGYMDVIALAQAGMTYAVAPLGTALTEDQVELLWRVVPEPVLCFDGDAAGQRAAARAAERALPRLRPEKGLRFMQLPAGDDPDSLVADQGAHGFQALIEQSIALSELIWRMESEGRPLNTAEDRAALEARLKSRAFEIENRDVQAHYLADFKDRLWQQIRGRRQQARQGRGQADAGIRQATASRPAVGGRGGRELSERLLLAVIIQRPEIFQQVDEALGKLSFVAQRLDQLRQATLAQLSQQPDLDHGQLIGALREEGFGDDVRRLLDDVIGHHGRFAAAEREQEFVLKGWNEALDRYICDDLDLEIEHLKQRLEQDMSLENERELHDLIVYRREFGPFAGLARQDRRVGIHVTDRGS